MLLLAAALLDTLLRLVAMQPDVAFDRAPELRAAPWRDRVQREAFFALASKDPPAAHRRISSVLERDWLADLPFTLALEQAYALPDAEGRQLLERAARRQPEAALREVDTCLRFTYGQAIIEAAIAEAPTEAALLAERLPALAKLVSFRDPATAVFAFKDRPPGDSRLAALLDFYREDPSLYWHRAAASEAADFFRLLHQSGLAPLASLTGPQRLTLASLARAEDEVELVPALLLQGDPATLPAPVLRRVMALAAHLDRFSRFDQRPLIDKACRGVSTLSEALDAATILGATAYRPALGDSVFARLLSTASSVGPLVLGPSILERFVFPNDDDGVESYDSFRASYAADSGWQWKEADGVVQVTSKAITIVANVPMDIVKFPDRTQDAEDRRRLVETVLPRPPEVFVHRGHDYHVPRTLPLIPRSAKLIFLGSCRGTQVLADIVDAAPHAQIVATRGIGTKEVNDPFLKTMNRHLLRSAGRLDWPALWKDLRASIGDNERFRDYVSPPDNAAANFLARYYAYLDSL